MHAVQNDANWQNNDLEVVFNTRFIGIAGEESWRGFVENQGYVSDCELIFMKIFI